MYSRSPHNKCLKNAGMYIVKIEVGKLLMSVWCCASWGKQGSGAGNAKYSNAERLVFLCCFLICFSTQFLITVF